MGNRQSTQLNDVQALLNAIRRKDAGEGLGIESDLSGTSTHISDIIEQSTITEGNQILQDLKLKFISEVIKSDKVETFMEVMEEGHLKFSAPIGSLQLTPLHLAAYHNSFNIIKHLIQLPQVHVNCPNKEKDTPLNLGLFGAETDVSAMELIRIFSTRRDLKTYCKNQKHMFPLLITVQKKFTGASKLLMSSHQRNTVDQYETWDLVNVIKLSITSNQGSITDLIHQNLGVERRLQVVDDIKNNSEASASDLFQDLVDLLEKTLVTSYSNEIPNSVDVDVDIDIDGDGGIVGVVGNDVTIKTLKTQVGLRTLVRENKNTAILTQKTMKISDKTGTGTGTGASTAIDTSSTILTQTQKIMSTTVRSRTTIDPDLMTTNDAAGNSLRIGNIVRTLSPVAVKRGLPPNAKEADILRVAEKIATIHEILGNKIYLEIHGDQCVAKLKADAVIFHDEGVTKIIRDNTLARIGSFVKIIESEEELKKLAGSLGWVHGMGDTCGRTGRIVRIPGISDILVQFAWGPRCYFQPDALLQSSGENIETQDYKNNWITVGSLVQIKKFRNEFEEIQKKNNLPFDVNYATLSWKFAVVKAIRIKAFSLAKTIKIIYKGSAFLVDVECIELINSVKDGHNEDIMIGDEVKVLSDKVKLKLAQKDKPEFGDWDEGMYNVLGQMGKVIALCIAEKSGLNAVMVKVEFPDSTCFFFNPRALNRFKLIDAEDKDTLVETPAKISAEDDGGNDEWEQIDRKNLECFEDLGEGSFGRVVRAEWTQNGEKKLVAIKQIKPRVTKGIGMPLRDILKEAKIQFSLRHPNIVPLFGISMEQDLWIVMDLVDGMDLQTILFSRDCKDRNTLTLERKVKLSLDMSNAIAYIHQKRYLHCDIKPLNMMVDRRSGKLFVCDFGITKFLGNMDLMEFATQYTDHYHGTLYFISPECLQLNKTTRQFRRPTFSADIWALGAVFYELFTLKQLYDNQFAFYEDKITNDDELVKKQMLNLPEEVTSIVAKALDFDHTARPSAQDLCEFFHELLLRFNTELVDADVNWEKVDRNQLKCYEVRGEGTFGVVVRGEWTKDGERQIVAIKQVKNSQNSSGARTIADALKEAKIQSSLSHPNIVELFGVSLEHDIWIVMEFVEGIDLHTLLFPSDGSDNSLTFLKKVKLSVDLSSAIGYMHREGYLHGDIKPHNMLVDERVGKLYVCEFGESRYVGPNSASVNEEDLYTDCMPVSLFYTAPECLQQDTQTKKYMKPTFASEIWALGAVFYELFSRTHSPMYENQMDFIQDKISGNDTIVMEQVAKLPDEIKAIVSQSLDFNHTARPSIRQICDFFRGLI